MAKTAETESVRRAKRPGDVKMSCAARAQDGLSYGARPSSPNRVEPRLELYKAEVKTLVTKLMALVEHRRGKTVKRGDVQFIVANGGRVQSFLPAE